MSGTKTILLVDDSEDDRMLMREAFRRGKCSNPLQEVAGGEESIAYLKGEALYSDRAKFPLPAVMLLDLNMPRIDGFGVLRWVRAQPGLKRLAIFIMTASARTEDIERAFDLGATSFLVKPGSLERLTAIALCLCQWVEIVQAPPLD